MSTGSMEVGVGWHFLSRVVTVNTKTVTGIIKFNIWCFPTSVLLEWSSRCSPSTQSCWHIFDSPSCHTSTSTDLYRWEVLQSGFPKNILLTDTLCNVLGSCFVTVTWPCQKLIRLCGEVLAAPTENEEIQFLCIVCAKLKQDPYLVNFFLEVGC